jgi:putative tricarboxylic transport membrane protein
MGVFGFAEIMRNLDASRRSARGLQRQGHRPDADQGRTRRIGAGDLRGTALGSILGILPGGGALIARSPPTRSRRRSPRIRREFGKGAIEGVAAPEAPTTPARRPRSSRC